MHRFEQYKFDVFNDLYYIEEIQGFRDKHIFYIYNLFNSSFGKIICN